MTKRILSLVLTIAMMCAFVPCIASAADSGTCGDNVSWVLDDAGTLYISGTGDMWNYSNNGNVNKGYAPWFEKANEITSIIIGDCVTYIGVAAFYNCNCATSVIIGNDVTGIGGYAFQDCTGLTDITKGDNITSIGVAAFTGCTGLKSFDFSDNLISIGRSAFSGCTALRDVIIPNSITAIEDGTFFRCTALRSVVIGDNVISIGEKAFGACTNMTSLSMGSKVTTISDSAFSGCQALTSLIIPDKVTTISDSAFRACFSLENVIIGNSVTTINDNAFAYCTHLSSITLPYSLTTIGKDVFSYCDNLSSVHYEGSAEDWDFVKIGTGNDNLTNAAFSYNSDSSTYTAPTYTAPDTETVIVVLNGVTLVFDYPPTVIDGRTLVPLRKIFESIGATVTWDDATQTVISTYNGVTITLTIGSNILYKNGYPTELDVPAQLLDDYTMVPVRAVAESFGADVGWDEATGTVTIVTQ